MDRCVSPAGTSLPTLLSFFFHVCGDGRWFSPPPHSYPCPDSPPSPSLPQEAKEGGEGWGGQGSPSVLRLHRVFRLNQEIFYYQKEKRKKKISQRPPFLPAPLGQSRLDLWGFPGGWLRAGTLSGKSGGVPCQALRQAHFGLLPSPLLLPLQANHQRWPSPDLRPLGWRPGWLGAGAGVLAAAWGWQARRGARPPSTLYPLPLLPEAGHFLPQAAVGTFVPLLKKSVPSSPTPS